MDRSHRARIHNMNPRIVTPSLPSRIVTPSLNPRINSPNLNPRINSPYMNPRIKSTGIASQENRAPSSRFAPRSSSQPIRSEPVFRPYPSYSSQKRKPLQQKVLTPISSQQRKLAPIAEVIKIPDPVRLQTAAKVVSNFPAVEEDNTVPHIIRDEKKQREFERMGLLGSGAFARVYKIKAKDDEHFAIKVMSKASLSAKNIKQKILAEINIHRVLMHDFIVKFHTCFEDKKHVYLVLELCENHTLAYMAKSRTFLTEDETRYYMGQIFSALRYMSDNRIAHRDLKLSNVLLDENMDCKVCDFGLAALLLTKEEKKRSICGTPHYIAPEILQRTGHNHKVDMWSAGILMYDLLFGKHPFNHESPELLYQQVKSNGNGTKYTFPSSKEFDVSDDAKDLIQKLLVNNPDQRLDVIDALEHPFFSQHDIPESIPHTALYREPSHRQLFPSKYTHSQETSRVAQAINAAKDRKENYADHRTVPPLKLMNEVVLDPRSQFPIRLEPSQMNIPIPKHPDYVYSTKRRNSVALSQIPKRICSDTRKKPIEIPKPAEIQEPDEIPRPSRLLNPAGVRKIASIEHKKTVPVSAAKQEFNKIEIPKPAATATTAPTQIPVPSVSSTKRRNSDALSQIPKRICSDTRKKPIEIPKPAEVQEPYEIPRISRLLNSAEVRKIASVGHKNTVPVSAAKQEFVPPLPLPHRKPALEEMAENLRLMIDRGSAIPNALRKRRVPEMEDFEWEDGNVFVQNWVDGTRKYGFGYRLSDGVYGILFNDNTTMTTVNQRLYALTYRDEDNTCVTEQYHIDAFPPELDKKRIILNMFITFLKDNHVENEVATHTTDPSKTHVFKYIVSDDAITFRLSNGVIQVNKFDKEKIILYDKGKKMMYIDQHKHIHRYYSTDVFNSAQTELIEALKSVYDILDKQNRKRQWALRELRWNILHEAYHTIAA